MPESVRRTNFLRKNKNSAGTHKKYPLILCSFTERYIYRINNTCKSRTYCTVNSAARNHGTHHQFSYACRIRIKIFPTYPEKNGKVQRKKLQNNNDPAFTAPT